MMEEIREEKIAKILSWLQAAARGKMARIAYKKLQEQKACVMCTPPTYVHQVQPNGWDGEQREGKCALPLRFCDLWKRFV